MAMLVIKPDGKHSFAKKDEFFHQDVWKIPWESSLESSW